MRSKFPGNFQPTTDEYKVLWENSIFVVDANVLLNLYRYSSKTRTVLENAITQIKERIHIPYQAAKEFLNNRPSVISGQSAEYKTAIEDLSKTVDKITNPKKHPFIDSPEREELQQLSEKIIEELNKTKDELLDRLTNDEVLKFIESIFTDKTGDRPDEKELDEIITDGERRYQEKIPPGYKDSSKDSSGDGQKKFGDLIIWNEIIKLATSSKKPIIFITDDKKEDWWLEQSGRKLGPRPELIDEFMKKTGQKFWMYTVDQFLTQNNSETKSQPTKDTVDQDVINEVIEIQQESQEENYATSFKRISKNELIAKIKSSEVWARDLGQGFVGLAHFVKSYLGNAGFDYSSSYKLIDELYNDGVIEIYDYQSGENSTPVKSIRLRTPS